MLVDAVSVQYATPLHPGAASSHHPAAVEYCTMKVVRPCPLSHSPGPNMASTIWDTAAR